MKPKVTIVTSVFNGEKYLEDTIKNVLDQTYENIEYIIIDAGSSDRSVDIIKKYEKKLAYWISEKDSGMYDGINKGFQQATGDIYAYLNADDLYFSKNTIELVVNAFLKDDSLDLVFGDVEFIDANNNHMYFYNSVDLLPRFISYLKRVPFAQQTTFWKANVYSGIGGFDSKLKYVADSRFFFSLIFYKNCKYKKINKIIAKFRWHNEGFSSAQKKMMDLEYNQMIESFGFKKTKMDSFMKILVEIYIKIFNIFNILKKSKVIL